MYIYMILRLILTFTLHLLLIFVQFLRIGKFANFFF